MEPSDPSQRYEPPFAVHVLWAPAHAGAAIAQRLFHFLSHRPPEDPGTNGAPPTPAPTLEAAAGVPVCVGHHAARVQALLDQPSPSGRLAVVLLGEAPTEALRASVLRACAASDYGERWICLQITGTDPDAAVVQDLGRPGPSEPGPVEFEVGRRVCALLHGGEASQAVTVFVPEPTHLGASLRALGPPFVVVRTKPGSSLQARSAEPALCVAVRGEGFSDSAWVHTEVLAAKKRGIPIIEVRVGPAGELRTFPYGGNVRAVDDAHDLHRACLEAWLRHVHFLFVGPALVRQRDLPEELGTPRYLSRPPELVDLAQGPLSLGHVEIVLYPDPPLAATEAAVLRRANPRARYVTPSTFGDNVLQREPGPPLVGWKVALSLSYSPELPASFDEISAKTKDYPPDGALRAHLNAAVAYLSVSLVRFGAQLAYGGHLRADGYTKLLDDIVQAHNRDLPDRGAALVTFVARHLLDRSSPIAAEPIPVPRDGPAATDEVGKAVELALMRVQMAAETDARVLVGGKTHPKTSVKDEVGYAGRLPGQAEEALHHLRAGKPLYVAGGFRGAAGLVAKVLQGDRSDLPTEAKLLADNPYYAQFAGAFDAIADRVPAQPRSVDALWQAIGEHKDAFWAVDDEDLCPNGLTTAENERLLRTLEHDTVASLVVRGLMRLARKRAAEPDSPLRVLAFNGPIADALDVESYGVMTLHGRRLSRGEDQLDLRMKGALRARLRTKASSRIVRVADDAERLSGSWVIPADVKGVEAEPKAQVEAGVRIILDRARKYSIGSVAVGLFGLRLGMAAPDAVRAQIDAFLEGRGRQAFPRTLVICEEDPDTFAAMVAALKGRDDLLTIVLDERMAPVPSERLPVTLHIEEEGQHLVQFVRGSVRGSIGRDRVPVAGWRTLAARLDGREGAPPPFADHRALGEALAEMVLSPTVRGALREHAAQDRRVWDVLVDSATADIPFELLALLDGPPPALSRVVRRALIMDGIAAPAARTRGDVIRLLLIANPDDKLPGTAVEADAIQTLFAAHADHIEVTSLVGRNAAEFGAVRAKLAESFDVVHYAGHGTWDPEDPDQNGLVLYERTPFGGWGKRVLTAAEIGRHAPPEGPPLLVFLNACYAAKVQGFAQAVLAAGTHAFVGNRWEVDDEAASRFAVQLYRSLLLDRMSLGEALQGARRLLHDDKQPDWMNFQLYGADDLRIS